MSAVELVKDLIKGMSVPDLNLVRGAVEHELIAHHGHVPTPAFSPVPGYNKVWIRHVKEYDGSKKGGFRFVGDFVRGKDIAGMPEETMVVVCWHDGREKQYTLCVKMSCACFEFEHVSMGVAKNQSIPGLRAVKFGLESIDAALSGDKIEYIAEALYAANAPASAEA